MFSATAVYERTVKGHEEIRNKTHALTQGERLILVLVDGITPYQHLGQKLSGLEEGRSNRALQSLLARNLIVAVDGARPNSPAGKLVTRTIDGLLQHDPLDPVAATLPKQVEGAVVADGAETGAARESPDACLAPTIEVPERHRMTAVDFYLPLERAAAIPDISGLKPNHPAAGRLHMGSSRDEGRRRGDSAGRLRREAHSRRVQLRYWLLFIGLIAVMLIVIVQTS